MAVVPLSRPSSQRQRRSCNGQSGQKWVMVREKPERVGYPYLNFAKGVFGFADKPGDELCFLGIGVSRIRLLCDSLKLGLGHRSRTTNKSRDDRRTDRLRPPLDQIIDLGHPLSRPPFGSGCKRASRTRSTSLTAASSCSMTGPCTANPITVKPSARSTARCRS